MKKSLLLMAFLCIGLAGVKAQDTDVSLRDNVIYVDPIITPSGTQVVLSIKLKNTTEKVTGFQYDVYLPEGFTFVTKSNGVPVSSMSHARTSMQSVFAAAVREEGFMRTSCTLTEKDEETGTVGTFSGQDGEISTVTINIPETVDDGDYKIKITGQVLSCVKSATKIEGFYPEDFQGTITIKGKTFSGVVLNENSTKAPEATTGATKVRVYRTIKGGNWSTIVLPFTMTASQVAEAFGDDVQLGDFDSWEGFYASDKATNADSIHVNFKTLATTDGMEANHPYIIRTSQDITSFTVGGVTIAPTATPETSGGIPRYGTAWSFTGTYTAGTTVPAKSLFITDNQFWYSVGKTKMKAFRAYIGLLDVTQYYDDQTNTAGSKVSMVFDNGSATRINGVRTGAAAGKVYSVSGTEVNQEVNALPHGVYIVNGKKIVK